MESLFVRRQPKQGRVCLMLGASLLLHSGVVGIGALWTQPEPEIHTLPPVDFGYYPSPVGTVEVAQPSANETPAPTSTPEDIVKVQETPPPPTDTLDFAPPLEQTPPPRKVATSKPVSSVRPTGIQTNLHLPAGQPNSDAIDGPAKAAATWVMPHPPYPATSLAKPTGATTVRIITDATGRVSSVVILKSAGSPILDNQTEDYVRANWRGPANASRTTQFVYQLR